MWFTAMPIDPPVLAQEIFEAYKTGAEITEPPSRDAAFDLHAAYQTESVLAALRTAVGSRPVGWKVGYANKAMWRVLKLDTLVWAHMYNETVHYATNGEANYTLAAARAPKMEPEIVFKLKTPIASEGLDAAAALANVEWLAIGFEVIDCPFPNWQVKPTDFVAAFGLHMGLIVGEPMKVEAAAIPALVEQLAAFKVKVSKNGELVEEGAGKNSLRSPALCLAELGGAMLRARANAGVENSGTLAAGDLISSGTLTAGHLAQSGETWRADVEGLPLHSLTVHLS
jgi:2-oxo-3-hexenedioate decarboxylase